MNSDNLLNGMSISLDETYIPVQNDTTFRRQTKYIIICMLKSLVPTRFNAGIDPRLVNLPTSNFTFNKVNEYFSYLPMARKFSLPFHYYSELVNTDYVTLVGSPFTNTSWALELMCNEHVLPFEYKDSILICIQENYSLEPIERQLMSHLANNVITPLMRTLNFNYDRIKFLENLVDFDIVPSSTFDNVSKPLYLDDNVFRTFLKKFNKKR